MMGELDPCRLSHQPEQVSVSLKRPVATCLRNGEPRLVVAKQSPFCNAPITLPKDYGERICTDPSCSDNFHRTV